MIDAARCAVDLPPREGGGGRRRVLTPTRILFAAALAREFWAKRGTWLVGANRRAWASAMYDYAISTGDARMLPDELWPRGWRRDPLPDAVPPEHPSMTCAASQLSTRDWSTPPGDGTRRVPPHATLDNDEHRPFTENARRNRESAP